MVDTTTGLIETSKEGSELVAIAKNLQKITTNTSGALKDAGDTFGSILASEMSRSPILMLGANLAKSMGKDIVSTLTGSRKAAELEAKKQADLDAENARLEDDRAERVVLANENAANNIERVELETSKVGDSVDALYRLWDGQNIEQQRENKVSQDRMVDTLEGIEEKLGKPEEKKKGGIFKMLAFMIPAWAFSAKEKVLGFFKKMFNSLVNFVKGIPKMFGRVLGMAGKLLKKTILGIPAQLIAGIKIFGELFASVGEVIEQGAKTGDYLGAIGEAAQNFFASIASWAVNLFTLGMVDLSEEDAKKGIGKVSDAFGKYILFPILDFFTQLPEMLSDFPKSVTGFMNNIPEVFTKFKASMFAWWDDLDVGSVLQSFFKFSEEDMRHFDVAGNAISNMIDGAVESLVSGFNQTIDFIKQKAANMLDSFISLLPKSVRSFLGAETIADTSFAEQFGKGGTNKRAFSDTNIKELQSLLKNENLSQDNKDIIMLELAKKRRERVTNTGGGRLRVDAATELFDERRQATGKPSNAAGDVIGSGNVTAQTVNNQTITQRQKPSASPIPDRSREVLYR